MPIFPISCVYENQCGPMILQTSFFFGVNAARYVSRLIIDTLDKEIKETIILIMSLPFRQNDEINQSLFRHESFDTPSPK